MKKRFERIVEDIKSVKVQGAENVAKAAMRAYLIEPNARAKKILFETRPTEPLMWHALDFVSSASNKKEAYRVFMEILKKAHEDMVEKGHKLIKDDMNVYTHCHSTSVIDVLKRAKKAKKKFVVYVSEVEPLLQGHKTAEDLAKAGIKVVIMPDLAATEALRKCDIFLFGADAFTKKHVINKIGTRILAKTARENGIPVYSCGISLKFTKKKVKIEERPASEIFEEDLKNVKVFNPAFDRVEYKFVSGIVSEFGVKKPRDFIRYAKNKVGSLASYGVS